MALQIKQTINLSQQLIMTPQLQQAIKLLQLSRLELLDTIYDELETNPILEEQVSEDGDEEKGPEEGASEPASEQGEDGQEQIAEVAVTETAPEEAVDWESYLSEYNTGWAETPYEDRDTPSFESMTASKTNLNSHLLWQLSMSDMTDAQREIGQYIIGNLDNDGYLATSLEEIAQTTGYCDEEAACSLGHIQNFDPVGVAARDTRECLLIQTKFHGFDGTVVEDILRDHMDKLENKKVDQIAKKLSISFDEVVDAISIIRSFEPKPGRRYIDEDTIYVSPDIYVFKVGDEYEIVLNEDGLPKLRINGYYRGILSSKGAFQDGTKEYIEEKLKSAKWLIKSIHQRQRTIYRVTESIVQFQKDFLEDGVTSLRPLVLRDVAEDISMHESTISRVTTNKYVHTPQGVFELKFFFNSSINGLDGESISSESVKEHLRNIIKTESKTKPFSDQELADLLKKFNINVARRTVAKYRETLGILPSKKRKQPY